MIMKTTTRKARRTQKTVYEPIATNVYFDGHSYRVRMTKAGKRISQNFSSKRKAITFRNTVKAA
jgi:hypothetical protein